MAGILTAIGEAKVAASFGGTPLNLTTIRVGDGNGAAITPNRLMTDLVRRVGTAYAITLSARDNDTPTMWRVRASIPPGAGPFTAREIAVFDSAGDMIAIASHPAVEFLGSGGDVVSMQMDIVFPVSGQANISVSLSQDVLIPLSHQLRPQWLTVDGVLNAPPATPALGATYIIGAAPTGAWIGLAGAIAQWDGADWAITSAPIGHIVADNSKAESDPQRYLTLTLAGWVSAAASDVAFGFTRAATAAELASYTGTGFVTPANLAAHGNFFNVKFIRETARVVYSGPEEPGPEIFTVNYTKKSATSALVFLALPSLRLTSVASTVFSRGRVDDANDLLKNHYLIANNSGRNFQSPQMLLFSWVGIAPGSRTVSLRLCAPNGGNTLTIVKNPSSVDAPGWLDGFSSDYMIYEVEL